MGPDRAVPAPPRILRHLRRAGVSLTLLLALASVIAMHGIDPVAAVRAAGPVAAPHASGATVAQSDRHHDHTTVADCHHDNPTHEHCPTDTHAHHGQVCQSGAVTTALALPEPASTPYDPIPEPLQSLENTAADDAGWGSGCGPPSLVALSISRT